MVEDPTNPREGTPPPAPPPPSGEVEVALRPVAALFEAASRHLHWPLGLLVLAYLCSGMTQVRADEVAVVLRFGALVGEGPARIHGPGFLWALPRPLDEVLRIKTDRVHETRMDDLELPPIRSRSLAEVQQTGIDPTKQGYCLTGNYNILHAFLTVRYRIEDPIAWALRHDQPEQLLRDVVLAAMARSTAEVAIDELLTDRRVKLTKTVHGRAQQRLNSLQSGLEVVSIEIRDLLPPEPVIKAFWDVNDAYNEYQLERENALGYRATELPAAQAEAYQSEREAQSFAARRLARARGESEAFTTLLKEYRRAPELVRQRLYRETIERCLSAGGDNRYVPPPVGERYRELRITIPGAR